MVRLIFAQQLTASLVEQIGNGTYRVGDRLPKMVELFGLDPAVVAAAAKKRGRGGPRGGRDKAKGRKGDGPKGPKADAPKGDAAKGDAAKREQAKDEGLVVTLEMYANDNYTYFFGGSLMARVSP